MENISMFEMMYPTFKIDKPIRLIELFAGVGSQAMALRNIGVDFEHYKISEWEVSATASYKAIHVENDNTDYSLEIEIAKLPKILFDYGISKDGKEPMTLEEIERKGEKWQRITYNNLRATNNLGSICNFKGEDLEIVDTDSFTYLLTYSFPCFTGDTLVLTDKGYKRIEDIKPGDKVLTHKNRYKKILKTMNNGEKGIWKLKGMCFDEIKCTENHKFFTREMYRKYPRYENGKRGKERHFRQPVWKECKDLTKKDYLGIAINQNKIIPEWNGINFEWTDGRKVRHKNELRKLMNNHSFWWLVGRYIGDGWQRTQGGIIICCSKKEIREITTHLRNCNFNYSISSEKTVYKLHITLKELQLFVSQFGDKAINKRITNTIFDLPCEYIMSFLDGYISADGCVLKNGIHKISTISRELAYGVAQCVAKAYKTPYRIYRTKRKSKCVIEGRTVNQNDDYQVVWKIKKCKQDKAFYENGYIWFPISDIKNTNTIETVYDIEVEHDHSFTANGTMAHNCQDLSVAGKRKGMSKDSGTRSGLLWEVERLLNEVENLPQVLLMENVPQVISDANIKDFRLWQKFLEDKGYSNYTEILNAKNYGVAQNRERCFMVSILGKWNYNFPKQIPLTKTMKDYLEDEVDEKYYINSEKAQKLIQQLVDGGQLKDKINCVDGSINDPKTKEISNCIKARYDAGISNFKSDGNMVVIGGMQKNQSIKTDGICTTLTSSMDTGGGYVPMVAASSNTLTTVQKDNLLLETQYRIRKLTPKECAKLMKFSDEDANKMLEVNSNTQVYKQCGNSIVVSVLEAIFCQMNIKGCPTWEERAKEEYL